MINTQYINLNMTPSGVMPVMYCSQYDIGRPMGMVVYNGGEAVDLDSYTCTVEATRTDGTAITAAVITDDNIGVFTTSATMTNQADKYPAKLVLFDSNSRRVASLAFIMCVTPKTMDENAESIEEDASLYQQYTEAVQSAIADIRGKLMPLVDAMKPLGTAAVYFPSLEAGGHSGSTALMVAQGKTVLFDAAPTVNKDAVMAYYQDLYSCGLFENIDVIIISHFHWDHIQCLGDILAAFPHDNCKAYIAMNPSGYYTESDASTILANRTDVLDTLEQYDVEVTEVSADTGITLVDGFCEIELFNSSAADYTYYSANTDYYNDYCMVSLVRVGDIYVMFPGDIQRAAQIHIMSQRELPRLFLYAIHHHGIQNDDYTPYLDMISPEWAVMQTNHSRGLVSGASAMAANYSAVHLGSSAYCSHEFVMQKNSGYIVGGYDLERSGWYYTYIDYYVDNSYTGTVHDGTEDHPYTSINEVNLFIKDDRNLHYRVHVKATSTAYDLLWMRDYHGTVEFIGIVDGVLGKPVVNGIYVKACTNILFTNFIFKVGRTTSGSLAVCYVAEATAYFNGVEIDGENTENINAVLLQLAEVYLSSCTIKNCLEAFSASRYGRVITSGITFSGVTTCYRASQIEIVIRGDDSVSNITNYITSTNDAGIPVTILNVDLTNLKSLCAYNGNQAMSLPFRNGSLVYKVRGTSIVSDATWANSSGVFVHNITDLNDAVNCGFYVYLSSASNRPSAFATNNGMLFVFGYNQKYFVQIASAVSDTYSNLAVRKCVNGTFGAWQYITVS